MLNLEKISLQGKNRRKIKVLLCETIWISKNSKTLTSVLGIFSILIYLNLE